MSASLVGSEMCIRDRWKTEDIPPTRVRRRKTHQTAKPVWERGPRDKEKRCLLYTSDAADDM
eukprot:15061554-Alexandrium_andersonii.AAC.1